jgi:hypothetical protein
VIPFPIRVCSTSHARSLTVRPVTNEPIVTVDAGPAATRADAGSNV